MTEEKAKTLFETHVPALAVDYCLKLYTSQSFKLTLRKNRVTKVGDFSYRPGHLPRITVNHDLHPYLFLITYIHEVAHLVVHQQHKNRAEAHGAEWKTSFQTLLAPVLTPEIFPTELFYALKKHMINPKASSFSDAELTKVIRTYDPKAIANVILSEIPEGSIFSLNRRWFTKGKLRRTRFECRELKSKKNYLVPADVPVENAQLSLL
jgi:SprT protein